MIIHALQTSTPFVYEMFRIGYCIRSKCTSDKYFLFKWSTRLQSMYNHMIGPTASVISLFYSLLPGFCWMGGGGKIFKWKQINFWEKVEFKIFLGFHWVWSCQSWVAGTRCSLSSPRLPLYCIRGRGQGPGTLR